MNQPPPTANTLWIRIKKDQFTFWMLLFGMGMIVLLPFGVWERIRYLSDFVPWSLKKLNVMERSPVVIWEVTAAFWSLLYCLLFMLFKLDSAYNFATPSSANPRTFVRIGKWFSLGTIVISVLVFIIFRIEHGKSLWRICAEALIVTWLVFTDYLLAYPLSVPDEVKKDYKRFLWGIDLPGLVGFLVLIAYLICSGEVPDGPGLKESFPCFTAGAAAMNLLLINNAFAILFLKEGGAEPDKEEAAVPAK